MSSQPQRPRLASEDVIINAPMSYAGSAQRIMRLRRRTPEGSKLVAVTTAAVILIVMAWVFVTLWYLIWGFWLVPYRLLRRGARKRKMEALRHRELMATIQRSAGGTVSASYAAEHPVSPTELVADADREQVMEELRGHLFAGRLTASEFEQRLDAAQRARTQGDLARARSDLPAASRPGPADGPALAV
jgi:hypothetical protein